MIAVTRRALTVAVLLGATLSVAACGGASSASGHAGTPTPALSGMGDMPGMSMAPTVSPLAEAQPAGDGLAASVDGYSFVPASGTVPAGVPTTFDFHINGPDGHTVTRYQPYRSELMFFDVIRADLTGYQHIETAMRQDGTWSVRLPALSPGSYRAYVTFAAPDSSAGTPLVYELSRPFTVPGPVAAAALPAPSASGTAGDIAVTLSGRPMPGVPSPLTLGFTSGGKPVSYFQRFLDGYAHVVAFHAGDLALAHLTPADRAAGRHDLSQLTTRALFGSSGTWRVFVLFRTSGPVRTVAFTVDVP